MNKKCCNYGCVISLPQDKPAGKACLPANDHKTIYFKHKMLDLRWSGKLFLLAIFPNIKILNLGLNKWILLHLRSIVPLLNFQAPCNPIFLCFPKLAVIPWDCIIFNPLKQMSHSIKCFLYFSLFSCPIFGYFIVYKNLYQAEIWTKSGKLNCQRKRKLSEGMEEPTNNSTIWHVLLIFLFLVIIVSKHRACRVDCFSME